MTPLKLLDLFSGIGGFSLGLERSGLCETVAFCEIEPFPRKVLAKHWPEVPIYNDVRTLTADTLSRDGIAVDVICGGFPCQDISTAGKGAGLAGERSGLWSEIARLVGELRPRYVIVENVSALLGRGLETFSETFPRSGMMRSGIAFLLPTLVPGTGGTEYGWLPTPNASADAKGCPKNRYLGSPTYRGHLREYLRSGADDPIYPHPTFVEALMGFPTGHTALKPSETP